MITLFIMIYITSSLYVPTKGLGAYPNLSDFIGSFNIPELKIPFIFII